ncbi:hypothetical protein C1N74_16110 (plasmid) [Microbacterium sp. SGAir0570]|uniref:hypothetical protein n=1 Tax=Microbacterium sp. SGAir0570 TaxID=2070348 RepID=UPI0010CD099E|nr:hypothetical protein [Microbacterium sp. SGAir0570]QCR42115.1 hypothetical protein C1N74_16110 [Microbacterium sp. SGAir0570]
MTANQPDRPARSRPRPAPDAGVDPIDYKPSPAPAPAPATVSNSPIEGKGAEAPAAAPSHAPTTNARFAASTPPAPVAGGSEVTVQLATRISPDVAAVLDAAVAREKARRGSKASKRVLVEEAILALWSQ